MQVLRSALITTAIPLVAAAFAALVGLGVVRGLTPVHVAVGAALLTVLPIAGLRATFGGQPWSTVGAVWVWPLCVLAGLPGYFPGEVGGAIATGLAVLAAPGGSAMAEQAARFANRMSGPIKAMPSGEKPPPEADRSVECPPAATLLEGDQVALPYEGKGHSMVVPVDFGGVELPMLFDTGASVTTLDSASLKKLGVRIPADAPEITLRTANGERTSKIVLLDRVWVGGMAVDGVTIGLCEECADDRTAGLLGLNVSGQFLVTVDTASKEVIFQARAGGGDRLIDVSPWLKVQATARVYPDTRVEVDVEGANRSTRPIMQAEVGITCGEDHFRTKLKDIPPGQTGHAEVSLPRGSNCEKYKVSLEHAKW